MNKKFRKSALATALAIASSGIVLPATAQSSGASAMALEEIIVTARRRDESVQDVPLTVNAVTADTIDDLNIRNFEDLQGVVAGLTLQASDYAPNASLRGVRFDTFISGNNSTVEFYLNDAPVSGPSVMQSLFDVSQVEVLRGPQGTLRGKASPSGSITVTTQRPILDAFGGYVEANFNDLNGQNYKGALNVPIIEDTLGIRFAGLWDENPANDATSIHSGASSEVETSAYRISIGYEPTDNLSINAMYQMIEPERTTYDLVESANIADPTQLASPVYITAGDRKSVMHVPTKSESELERINLEISWEFADQQLNYVGAKTEQLLPTFSPENPGDAFGPAYPDQLQTFGQFSNIIQESKSHELRLQSVEPLFDIIDYVVGILDAENEPGTNLQIAAPVFVGALSPFSFAAIGGPEVFTGGISEERSYFGNLTLRLGDATEVSGGMRRIELDDERNLLVGGNQLLPGFEQSSSLKETIYSFSLKHNFSDDLMVYTSYGESFRPGGRATGDFSLFQTPRELDFVYLDPETSDSIEVGIKSTWMDDRLRVNATVFSQDFENYPYRSAGSGVYYANFEFGGFGPNGLILNPRVAEHNFGAGVPVEVNGVELETFYQINEQWDVSLLYSYSKGEIDGGTIPCNDYLPFDGIPDASGQVPTVGDILATGDHVGACGGITQRSSFAPLWTATLTSEYNFTVGGLNAYVRGLWTLYGDSQNDPNNTLDDVDAYNILNLYAGVSDPEGTWQVMLYGKNIADTEEVLDREANAYSVSYTILDPSTFRPSGSGTANSAYRRISMTPPREFGINLRYNF